VFSQAENNDGPWLDDFLDLPNLETDFEYLGNFWYNDIWFEDSDLSIEQWFDSDHFLEEDDSELEAEGLGPEEESSFQANDTEFTFFLIMNFF